ncbi:NAD(P)/FAD-dependent oxidoreductase [Nocardia sp. CC227C]|uniref:FAD/NAD(P)-dependent oxidoreductase n=1 Tax=Nocardia sp. CC227C TaxID=3044562 RepID=UPI00278BB0FA|nr:NAD(P)/FAD-dependent oxidoreductase [Nocardia sp. CC227C]
MSTPNEPYLADVAVVGAGPAGLAAAVHAAESGLRVVLVDAGHQLGGQYWRHPDEAHGPGDESHGHQLWPTFTDLRARCSAARADGTITYLPGHQVWFLEQPATDTDPYVLHANRVVDTGAASGCRINAESLILSPGGYDRQLPIDGWDLPGVMAAGGVQALLKGHRTLAGRRVLVAGTGPFLLPVATGLAEAGAEVVAVCEANALTGWLRHPIAAAAVPSKAVEGARYAAAFLKHRLRLRPRTIVTAIHGGASVQSVTLSRAHPDGSPVPGTAERVEVDLVALGWGFTPSLELIVATGARTRVDVDGSLVACVDDRQRSSIDRVFVAGEATGVGGAALAVAEGALAGLAVAQDHGRTIPARRVRALRWRIRRGRAFARAMHTAHPIPPAWARWLTPDTVVCRCEEVTHADICAVRADLGATDARTVKLLARPGMGWCQGRVCGYATAALAAGPCRTLTEADLLPNSKRPLIAPITLGELAESPEP